MSRETKIQWCDSTVNPVMGCDGCELWVPGNKVCYAGTLHARYSRNKGYADNFDVPEEFPGRMAAAAKWKPLQLNERKDKPWLNGLPRLIFVSDMGDALSESISYDYLRKEILNVVSCKPGSFHRWLWLTKRPSRMVKFYKWMESMRIPWPTNLVAMTSITGRQTMRRASFLRSVGTHETIRGISFEPLIDEPDWDFCLTPLGFGTAETGEVLHRIDWAIFGGQSGKGAPPFDANILRRGIEACRERGVKVFVKQMGANPVGIMIDGELGEHNGDWNAWPRAYAIREMPDFGM